jgi:hypothetical protein
MVCQLCGSPAHGRFSKDATFGEAGVSKQVSEAGDFGFPHSTVEPVASFGGSLESAIYFRAGMGIEDGFARQGLGGGNPGYQGR